MGERGSGTLLAAVAALVIAGLTAVALCWATVTTQGHRLQGAADLAALAGAEVQMAGGDACAAARESASLNAARVTECGVAGDEVEFVVTVRAEATGGIGVWRTTLRSHANAGVVTGSEA